MNIAFFLMPKQEIVYLPIYSTMRQALEKMEHHRYTAIPLVNKAGEYVGTLTEGDLLWRMKQMDSFCLRDLEAIPLADVERNVQHEAVSIYSDIEALLNLSMEQNFVPVVDDKGIFIGIVPRKTIITFLLENYKKAGYKYN